MDKLVKLETFSNEFVGFVRATSESGATGWGQVSTYNSDITCDIFHRQIAPHALGTDAFDFEDTLNLIGEREHKYPGSYLRRAMTGLDVDANSCYSPKRAIEVGKLLAENGISHFEEPCPYWEYEQTREVTEALEIDVTGGEQDCEYVTFKLMMDMKAVDIVQPDIMYIGGLTRTLNICEMAAERGFKITPHAANLSLVTMCTMHLLGAIPNAGKYLEFSIEEADYYPWQYGLFLGDPHKIEDGKATIPDEPGWGVEINPTWLEKAQYHKSEMAR